MREKPVTFASVLGGALSAMEPALRLYQRFVLQGIPENQWGKNAQRTTRSVRWIFGITRKNAEVRLPERRLAVELKQTYFGD